MVLTISITISVGDDPSIASFPPFRFPLAPFLLLLRRCNHSLYQSGLATTPISILPATATPPNSWCLLLEAPCHRRLLQIRLDRRQILLRPVPARFSVRLYGHSAWFWRTWSKTSPSSCSVAMVSSRFDVALVSACCTAKQPPNGPATALLRQRTVQITPVDLVIRLIM